jgi:16S rRNA processing protein RimM
VGRAHGLDGSFYVDHVSEPLEPGTEVTVGGRAARVERRAGIDDRPIVRLSGIGDRNAAEALRGERILVDGGELSEDEYLTADLVGCEVPGLGVVRRVVAAPSCDLLEVGDERVLVPLIADAVTRVDTEAKVIEVDAAFLGLELDSGGATGRDPEPGSTRP